MSTLSSSSEEIGSEKAEELARENPGLVTFGRIGWVAKGIVYGLTGFLALTIGISAAGNGSSGGGGSGGEEASQQGAIARIAESPAGTALLIAIAVGLVIYSIWRLISIALPADNDASGWATRIGYAVSAATYLLLAWTAFSIATNPGTNKESEDAKVERYTRDFLDMTGGRVIVFLAGAALIVIAGVFLWKAIDAKFEKQLKPGGVGPISHDMLVMLGRIGWVGRSGMMALIGFFLARAAIRFDPDEAKGLDGSLRQAAGSTFGTILVLIVAVGLTVYGVFCVISAPRRRLVGADG